MGRDSSCYEEHIQRCDDLVVGCFERESENIFLPQAYKLYKHMADVPIIVPIIPAFDANETNTADSAVSDGVQDGSDGDSNSSDSDSSG
jgi:hypothetical protein